LGKIEHFVVNVVHRNSSLFITCDVLIGSDIAGLWSFIGFTLHSCIHAVHLIVHMSVCPFVCLFACINWTTTGQIFMKFDIEDIY